MLLEERLEPSLLLLYLGVRIGLRLGRCRCHCCRPFRRGSILLATENISALKRRMYFRL